MCKCRFSFRKELNIRTSQIRNYGNNMKGDYEVGNF